VKTIALIDQLKASAEIYERELARIEELSDAELLNLFSSASTVDRVLWTASAETVARVLRIASAETVARVLWTASAETVDRVLGIASASTVARVLRIASAETVDRVLLIASASTVARVLGIASASTVARVARLRNLTVPVVEDLDRKMYEATKGGENFDMNSWHCGTTHCRAGWAITLAGEAGSKLEEAVGSAAAGRYIYEASTGRPAPDFYASTMDALADIARCAGVSE
jgi:hypothetical protein